MSMMMGYEEAAAFEMRFWLQIAGDHARFIKDTLSSDEKQEVARARAFAETFDALLSLSRQDLNPAEWAALAQTSLAKFQELRELKLHLIERHLASRIQIGLSPTFLNHMVNEAEEAIRVLSCLAFGRIPAAPGPVHLHLLWLSDAAGHAAGLSDFLDQSEKKLKTASDDFTKSFEQYYLKAVEMAGFLRTRLPNVPALSRLNKEAELEILLFMEFLRELEELKLKDEVLGTISLLMPDHMMREECYYLAKLSLVSEVAAPACEPAKPRTE